MLLRSKDLVSANDELHVSSLQISNKNIKLLKRLVYGNKHTCMKNCNLYPELFSSVRFNLFHCTSNLCTTIQVKFL